MNRRGKRVSTWAGAVLALACLSINNAVFAYSTAVISGRVTDSNNDVIAGAKIDVSNIDTNITSSVMTNSEGLFVIPNLSPGRYRIFVHKDGFQTVVKPDVTLHVQDIVSLSFVLQLGSIAQSVTIEGGAPLIQKDSAAVGALVDRQFVGNLPLNGRSFQSLITLTPGTALTSATEDSPGQFSVNGQRANANYFTVDGVSANAGVSNNTNLLQAGGSTPALSAAGGTNSLVSVDALQEFKVLTSTYAPEFGRTPGGQVQIVTRSGTNRFSGALFEYFRNDALDANDWFANSRRLPKPAMRQNDFGGVLGGPIIKNKTFFFFSYEGLRLRQPLTVITDVPSVAARQKAAPQMRPFLEAFPRPNGPDRIVNGASNGLAEFSASFSNPSQLDATSVRIDHTFNEKLAVFGRYNDAPSGADQRGSLFSNSLSTVARTRFNTKTLTLGSTQTVSPGLSNDFRFNFSRIRTSNFYVMDQFGGAVPLSDSLLFPSFTSARDALFGFYVDDGLGTNFNVGKTQINTQDQFNVVNHLSVVAGSHQLKFGFDYRRVAPTRGLRTYDLFVNPSSVASLLTGLAEYVSILQFKPEIRLLFNNYSAYGQDTWKATPRMTLTYGVRWEINPAPAFKNAEPPFAITGVENPATLALAAQGSPLYKTTYNNFAPRVGLAYQLSQKSGRETILRGGFGVFYDLGSAAAGAIPNMYPYRTDKSLFGVSLPLSESQARPTPFSTALPVVSLFTGIDPDLKLPRTYQWNAALEQSLGAAQTVSATYVGAIGRRLTRQDSLSAPNANFRSTVFLVKDTATSDYHSMQLQYQRRLTRGLQAIASYTWAHSIDDASGDTVTFGYDRGRGPSSFDIRRSFSSAITYNLPTLLADRIGRKALGGWSVDSIVAARSATPVNVARTSLLPTREIVNLRPNLNPGVPLYLDDPAAAGGRRINPAAFSNPPPQQQGSLGRNALRGFSVWQTDFALRRQFPLTERVNLQFRTEFFNLLNHPNFANPNGNLSQSATFGRPTQMFGRSLSSSGGAGLNALYQIGGPRSIQFSLKLSF